MGLVIPPGVWAVKANRIYGFRVVGVLDFRALLLNVIAPPLQALQRALGSEHSGGLRKVYTV